MRWLLLPIWLCTASFLFSQSEIGRPVIVNYGPDLYDAHFQNWDVLQDDKGLIYVANGDAILQYDGVSWRKLELPNLNRICTLAKDAENRIYVGADQEMGYIDFDHKGHMRFVSLVENIPEEHRDLSNVWNVFVLDEHIFFSSNNKIYLWDGEVMEVLVYDYPIPLGYQARENLYFRVRDVGLMQYENRLLKLIPGGDLLKRTSVFSVLPFDTETVLVVSREGMFQFNGKNLKTFANEIDDYLKKFLVYKGLKINNQYVFGTLNGGLVLMDQKGNKIQIITKKNGLSSNQIYNLGMDNQSGLWVTSQNGVSRLELLRPFSVFDESNGLEGKVSNIHRHQGRTYVANTYGLFVLQQEGDGQYGFKAVEKFNMRVWDLVSAGEDLIVGTEDGVFRYNGADITQINEIVTTILYRSRLDSMRIYIGHPKGISAIYYDEGKWINEGDAAHVDQDLLTIAETNSGDLWFGTRPHGVVFLKADENGKWGQNNIPETFSEDQGVPPGYSKVYIINDKVWLRADCELNEQCFLYFQKDRNRFMPDTEFAKTFNASPGSYLYRHQAMDGHLLLREQDHKTLVSVFHLTSMDYQVNKILLGSLDRDVNRCVYWERDKVLWLAGDAVVRYDLTNIFDPLHTYPVYVRKVTSGSDSVLFAGLNSKWSSELSIKENALRFEFAAPFFDSSEKSLYQYKLEGFDEKWSSWSYETKKDYTNLSAGEYQFKVRARNVYKTVGESGSYVFTIAPPWYSTIYAYLLYGILAIFLVWLVAKWRNLQLQREKEALEKVVAERTEEVMEQADQLKVQAEQLQELDRAKSRFFANISHEFRTPLSLIKGPIERLEQNFDEKLSMSNVKMIRRNANRLLNMVNQLLDLSKIDEGSLKLNPTEGDIYKCLRAATSSFNSHAAQRNIDFKVHIPRSVLWTSFDRDKLENVVYNLLGNAFKFSEDGSIISFDVDFAKRGLLIQVADSGKGIPEENLPYIFNRFYQVDSSYTKEKGGSGIGLSLSKDLVELMGGTIAVSSEVNKGTFFTIQLPIQEIKTRHKKIMEDVPEQFFRTLKRPYTLAKTDKRDIPTILLVEDNSDMRHFIKEQLLPFYKVREAFNGESGLKKANASPPELVITDLMMPKMDGIELCKELKTNLHTSHIPVIMLTAKAGMENKIEGLETGADDYLTKPFDADELLARTKNLIEQRENLRKLFANKTVQVDPKKITVTSIDQKFLEQVLALLEKNYTYGNFGVPQMQEALAMSKSQLHRKLKALTNEAPGELLRNFRLKRAAQLLSQKSDTVTQIAYRVGFNDLSHFTRCFKRLYGVVPSAY